MGDLVAFWVLGAFIAGCGGAVYDRATMHVARVGGVVGLTAGGLLLLMAAVGSGVLYGLEAYGAARDESDAGAEIGPPAP